LIPSRRLQSFIEGLQPRIRRAGAHGPGWSRDLAAWWLLGLGALPLVWLVFSVSYLPMQDLPGHLELGYLHQRLRAADPAFTPFYGLAPQPWPNSLSTVLLSLLGGTFGFTGAARLLLALYLLAWPLCLGLLARTLGRSPLVALLALPTALDLGWALGFLGYLLAKPLVVGSVVAAIAFGRRPSVIRGGLLWLLLATTFLAHAIAFAVAGVLAGLAVIFWARGWRRLTNLWPLLLAALVPWRYLANQPRPRKGWVMFDLPAAVRTFWNHLGDLGPGGGEEWAYGICFAMWCLLLITARRGIPSPCPALFHCRGRGEGTEEPPPLEEQRPGEVRTGEEPTPLTDRPPLPVRGERLRGRAVSRPETAFLCTSVLAVFLLYAFGPAHMPGVAIVSPRVLVFAWAFLMLLPSPILTQRWRPLLALPLLLAAAVHASATFTRYRRFAEVEMAGFRDLLRLVPPGAALATHYPRVSSPFVKHAAMWHWPKLHTIWNGGGGHSDDSFATRSTSHVRLTEAGRRSGTRDDGPGLDPTRLQAWDYLLVHGGDRATIAATVSAVAAPVASRADWQLYRIRPAPGPAAPGSPPRCCD
jgi:hypothetical protein